MNDNIVELKNGDKLLARIKIVPQKHICECGNEHETDGGETLEIYPVESVDVLSIEVKGNGFNYKSKK